MKFVKSIGAKYNDKGEILSPQQDIDMHPLEAACIQADWDLNPFREKVPFPPSLEQEHEWLIQNGADYVKQKRIEFQDAYKSAKSAYDEQLVKHQEIHLQWMAHHKECLANGLDPDTHDADKYQHLIPKDK